jgi:hypothetical protein
MSTCRPHLSPDGPHLSPDGPHLSPETQNRIENKRFSSLNYKNFRTRKALRAFLKIFWVSFWRFWRGQRIHSQKFEGGGGQIAENDLKRFDLI